jgi:hypothetical protein
MHVHQKWLSLNDCQVPRVSMFPKKSHKKNCKQHGHSPRYLTMTPNHRLRKNDTHTVPTSEHKVPLHNLLKPPTLAVGPKRQCSLTLFRLQ